LTTTKTRQNNDKLYPEVDNFKKDILWALLLIGGWGEHMNLALFIEVGVDEFA